MTPKEIDEREAILQAIKGSDDGLQLAFMLRRDVKLSAFQSALVGCVLAARSSIRPAQAAEPVAWAAFDKNGGLVHLSRRQATVEAIVAVKDAECVRPLYTAPQQAEEERKPPSDAQIDALAAAEAHTMPHPGHFLLTVPMLRKIIQAAAGIKGD